VAIGNRNRSIVNILAVAAARFAGHVGADSVGRGRRFADDLALTDPHMASQAKLAQPMAQVGPVDAASHTLRAQDGQALRGHDLVRGCGREAENL